MIRGDPRTRRDTRLPPARVWTGPPRRETPRMDVRVKTKKDGTARARLALPSEGDGPATIRDRFRTRLGEEVLVWGWKGSQG